ncbi:MAG: response regulator transcription factor [Bacteroidales bacterium]|nr:response regulator transcription factor [Bacteroidales bacterium]
MNQIKAIIVDDEVKALKSIEMIVNQHCENVKIVGLANSVAQAEELIALHSPNLVFLDVEMPEANGFELLERVQPRNFEVIFVTAFNHHALKAIKYSAFDYILKPVDIDEIITSVEKATNKIYSSELIDRRFEVLLNNLKSSNPKKLAIPFSEGLEFLDISQIIRLEADRSYTSFFMANRKTILVSKSMKEYEILEQDSFFRIHRSHLINLKHIKKFYKRDGGEVEMSDGAVLPVSRQKKTEFLEVLQSISV